MASVCRQRFAGRELPGGEIVWHRTMGSGDGGHRAGSMRLMGRRPWPGAWGSSLDASYLGAPPPPAVQRSSTLPRAATRVVERPGMPDPTVAGFVLAAHVAAGEFALPEEERRGGGLYASVGQEQKKRGEGKAFRHWHGARVGVCLKRVHWQPPRLAPWIAAKAAPTRERCTTESTHRRSGLLWERLTAEAAHCRSGSLWKRLTAGAAHCENDSLQERLTVETTHRRSGSLWKRLTAGAAHCGNDSLQERLTVGAAHCGSGFSRDGRHRRPNPATAICQEIVPPGWAWTTRAPRNQTTPVTPENPATRLTPPPPIRSSG